MRSLLQTARCDEGDIKVRPHIRGCSISQIVIRIEYLRIWQQSDNEMHNVPHQPILLVAATGDTDSSHSWWEGFQISGDLQGISLLIVT